jgi:hypothetical protein
MSFEFNLPLQTLRESFVLATSCYVDERAATSRETCRSSAKTRHYREHDDDLEACGAVYVSTFRWGEGRTAISSTAGIDYVSTFHGEGV